MSAKRPSLTKIEFFRNFVPRDISIDTKIDRMASRGIGSFRITLRFTQDPVDGLTFCALNLPGGEQAARIMIANSVSVVAHTNAHTGEKEMLFTLKAIAQKCDELSDQMAGQLVMDFARPLLERLQGDLAMAIASDAAVSEIKGQVIIGVDKHCFDWNKRQKSAERMPAELGYWEEELYEATLEAKAPQRIYKQGEGSW